MLTTWQNLSRGEYEGYDMNARWILPKNEWGNFRMELSGTYIAESSFTNSTGVYVDADGEYSFPLFRGSATLAWNKGDWAASLFVNYIGAYNDQFQIAKIDDQYTVNPQVSYKGWYHSTVTVGVRNILNSAPPIDLSDSKLVNENTNWTEPAFVYVRISKDW